MATTTPTTTAAKIRTLGPGVLKSTDSKLTIDLSSDVTKVSLTPSNSSDDPINYLDGSQEINTSTSWTLECTVQDDYTLGSINNWAFSNAGKSVPMQFIPVNAAAGDQNALAFTFNATIQPLAFGGDVKAKNSNDLSWPITNLQLVPLSTLTA